MQMAAGSFALATYGAVIGLSLANGHSILPYAVLLAVHAVAALWLREQGANAGGSDAAGNGLSAGLRWLAWLATSVGFACITWLAYMLARILQ